MPEFTREQFEDVWKHLFNVAPEESDWDWFQNLPASDQDAFMTEPVVIRVKWRYVAILAAIVALSLFYILTN